MAEEEIIGSGVDDAFLAVGSGHISHYGHHLQVKAVREEGVDALVNPPIDGLPAVAI